MRAWLFLLGGMIVWTVQFFSLYTIASVFGSSTLARILTVIVTLACLAVDAGLLMLALSPGDRDHVDRWISLLAALTAAISFVAVLWQGLPALLA